MQHQPRHMGALRLFFGFEATVGRSRSAEVSEPRVESYRVSGFGVGAVGLKALSNPSHLMK